MSATSGQRLVTQSEVDEEIRRLHRAAAPGDRKPLRSFPPYRSSELRHPSRPELVIDPDTVELSSPVFGHTDVAPHEADLTIQSNGDPIGERMVVTGRVTDHHGRPVRRQLVEVWQANAGGRYAHQDDKNRTALDPHFTGAGRALTDDDGRYRFTTIRPGPYPFGNHRNAWRPAHIHFSLFGTEFTQRLVTQMYFSGDPLLGFDPIYQSIPDRAARDLLLAHYDPDVSQEGWATGYRWDIVLTGTQATPLESREHHG